MTLVICADCDDLRRIDIHGRCESCGSMATFRRDAMGDFARPLALEHARRVAVQPILLTRTEEGWLIRALWRWTEVKTRRRMIVPIPARKRA